MKNELKSKGSSFVSGEIKQSNGQEMPHDVLQVPLQMLDDSNKMPAYAYAGDAGVDLRSTERACLKPFERKLVSTGIALAIPEGYAGFVLPRSGLAIKHGISLVNTPGLIDSNYRGEIKVVLINLDAQETFEIEPGDRIAQLVIMHIEHISFKECKCLSKTCRGEGGFGSSGV